MKKSIGVLILIIIFFFSIKAYASTTSIEINVEGRIKSGEEINILVNMEGLEGLYAASVDFSYDKSDLNILSITAGDSIKKYEDEIMEIGGEVDTDKNKTSYSFTFLGDKKGIDGNGTLAIIKAKVLNEENLEIGQDAIKIKLVKRVEDSVDNYDYNFIGYNKQINTENQEDNNNFKDSTSSGSNDIEINDSDTINNDTTDSSSSINANGENLENNKGENQYNEETKSSNDDTIKNDDKLLNSGETKSEASKNNSDSLIYILVSALILIGGIYYYFKFRKSKPRND